MNAIAGAKAYARVGNESGALAADPHKLISMLYQGALLAIANAKNGIMRKDVPAKGAAISKAIMIIDEGLKASLDKDVGGELAHNLASLYDYMNRRLLTANLKNDMAALDEVARLLTDLKEAWDGIRPTSGAAAPVATPAPVPFPQQPGAAPATAQQPKPMNKVQLTYGRM